MVDMRVGIEEAPSVVMLRTGYNQLYRSDMVGLGLSVREKGREKGREVRGREGWGGRVEHLMKIGCENL